jgi:anhydro-N-acetylmuramic acid kinase
LRDRILAASEQGDVSEICHLNVLVGELFAKAALKAISRSGLSPQKVQLIGSHGQTIHHRPQSIREAGVGKIRSTLQIGEPAVIAERTGIPTVSNFRARDMAAGGEGAPLTPYVHRLLFNHRSRSRLIVNLGGIVNMTLLPAGGENEDVQAFDVGPCNILLDGVIQARSQGKCMMDRGGTLAKCGRIRSRLLKQLLAHPFLAKAPPKSTGREEFGSPFIQRLLLSARQNHWSTADILATSCRFVAMSINRAQLWLRYRIDEVIVGGGGAYNSALMAELLHELHPLSVKRMEDCGSHSKAFEAKAFAVLAYQTFQGKANNIPAVTGACHPVILGNLTPGNIGKGA